MPLFEPDCLDETLDAKRVQHQLDPKRAPFHWQWTRFERCFDTLALAFQNCAASEEFVCNNLPFLVVIPEPRVFFDGRFLIAYCRAVCE